MNSITGFILYIDILGYKNLLRNNTQSENERVKSLLESFTSIYTNLNFALGFGASFEESKLFKRYFSDNFLFVYESEREAFLNFLIIQSIASQIQSQFLYCGMLTRGSITYGTIDYSDDIVYGVDLIKAVELESHPEPSVVVDEDLKDVLIKNNFEYKEHNSLFFVHGDSELDFQDVKNGIEKYLVELNKISPDQKTINKINWVVEQMNDYFSSTMHHYSLAVNSKVKLVCDN